MLPTRNTFHFKIYSGLEKRKDYKDILSKWKSKHCTEAILTDKRAKLKYNNRQLRYLSNDKHVNSSQN